MVATPEAAPIFADAWNLSGSALQWLEAGDVRDGAKTLGGLCYSRQARLHGDCFYTGITDGLEEIHCRSRETNLYIRDAENLA